LTQTVGTTGSSFEIEASDINAQVFKESLICCTVPCNKTVCTTSQAAKIRKSRNEYYWLVG